MSDVIERVNKVLAKVDASSLLGATFTAGICSETGRPKVSCALRAPDTGLHVTTGVKAGGLWPPHTVLLWPDATEQEVFSCALSAFRKALLHEGDEHFKVDGKLFINPHPEG